MGFIQKLDNSSRLLVFISLMGVAASVAGFYYYGQMGSISVEGREIVGKTRQIQNDTRVKRADDIQWYPIKEVTNLYRDDSLFTGEASTVTVEFIGGNKVTLQANSLITLSKNKVALETGTVEIDLSAKEALELESFGETFTLKDQANIRVTQNENEQNIVVLSENGKGLSHDSPLKKFASQESLNLISPGPGKIFPGINNFNVTFQWRSEQEKKDFNLVFWTPLTKEPFLKLKSNSEKITIPLKGFPAGIIFWKVTLKDEVTSDQSSFYVTKDINIRLTSPMNKDVFPFVHGNATKLNFEWISPLEYDQKIQLAKDTSFSNIIFEGPVASMTKSLDVIKEGIYFWRVGYIFAPDIISWSNISEFELRNDVKYAPIGVNVNAETLDFALNPSYQAEVKDTNPCDEYIYTLVRGEEVIHSVTSKVPQYTITKQDDGIYSLKVDCQINELSRAQATAIFVVKSSPPLKQPKTIKRKKPLFVKIWHNFLDLLIPQVMAAEETNVAPLQWEGKVGDDFEVEIIEGTSRKTIYKKIIQFPYLNFQIPRPGQYFWRVKFKDGDRWSPFSEWEKIEAEDKIGLIKAALMVYPEDKKIIEIPHDKQKIQVTFVWSSPFPDFKYVLEIYSNPNKDPVMAIPVTGTSRVMTFDKSKSGFWWRIKATSPFAKQITNTEKYQFTFSRLPAPQPVVIRVDESKIPIKSDLMSRVFLNLTNSSYTQNINKTYANEANDSTSLSGLSALLSSEYWPEKWAKKHGIRGALNFYSLNSDRYIYKRYELQPQYGFNFFPNQTSQHLIFFGVNLSMTNTDISKNGTQSSSLLSGSYNSYYAAMGYSYRRQLSEKLSLDCGLELLLPVTLDVQNLSYRFRPILNYVINQHWWVSSMVGLEHTVATPDYQSNDSSGVFNIATNSLLLGFGLTYNH